MEITLKITDRYLWIPYGRDADPVKLHFFSDGEKICEADVKLARGCPDFRFAADMKEQVGKGIVIRGDFGEGLPDALVCRPDKPEVAYPYRPELHFTAEAGWINDPNGLVFSDGVYHLFHQWNPYGTVWGNMHWGHAVSRDLFNWTRSGVALMPDDTGTMYSGSGLKDEKNAAGFGKDALLFFYTAAGGNNLWSAERGAKRTQRIAVSTDGGRTLEKRCCAVGHIKGGNRDPKVFYHEESGGYVMALFLDGYEFALLRSPDLLHWTETQRFSADGMRECPDLFRLPYSDGEKWIFWSADGYYMTGGFDGYRFTPDSGVLSAYDTKLPYAAQTYSGVRDRVISVAWLRTKNDRGGFRCMMSVPAELSLKDTADGPRIAFRPVRELWGHLTDEKTLSADGNVGEIPLGGGSCAIKIERSPGAAPAEVRIGGTRIGPFEGNAPSLFIIDHGIVEYYCSDGLVYGALEAEEDLLSKTFDPGEGASRIAVYRFGKEREII